MNSTSPYIHPDYYNPLQSPIDAKSSPLALLAKTCNAIGKDNPPAKPVLKSVEKKEIEKSQNGQPPEKLSMPNESKDTKQEKEKPGFRMIHHKDQSGIKTKSPIPTIVKSEHETKNDSTSVPGLSPPSSKASESSGSPHRLSSPLHSKPTSSLSRDVPYPYGLKQSSSSGYPSLSAASLGYPGLSLLGQGFTPELAALYHSQILAQSGIYGYSGSPSQQSALKASTAAMNPYVSYTRVRTSSGATTLVPVCKDPYCTNCQLTLQTAHTSTTCKTPGCSQCAHEKALTGLATGSPTMGFAGSPLSLYPQLSSLPSSAAGLSSIHALYAHPHSALSAHEGLPYVCNWVSGHDYCGKRFNSSEDLMQHLRSHTSSVESGLTAGYGLPLPPGLSTPSTGLTHLGGPTPISPNALRRAYPTSLSPGILGSSRFHPYKSNLGGVASTSTGQPFSPLSAYYPYSMYAQRLGAVVP
ncbi:hypothetical protein SNE40_019625 [Patella caerulea]|uniref:C2H2-type domain-containing protein n=1 Tax=Patella caerulea TaxID=87958 RepID=A0AAN8P9X7_PATCE